MHLRRRESLLNRLPAAADRAPGLRRLLRDGRPGRTADGPKRARTTSLAQIRRAGVPGLLRLLGPGLVTGASDDDPSGIATYSQVGSQFGFGVLWTALFTFPLMLAVQELCARIALQTGVGLGTSLRRKFPAGLVGACIAALVVANVINLGADLGAVAAGGSLLTHGLVPALWLVVPVAALILALQLFVSYRRMFAIFRWLTLALFAYVITGLLARPPALTVLTATLVPHVQLDRDFLQGLVAILGTTISPYLFFWQASSEIDDQVDSGRASEAERRGVKAGELLAARLDIAVGMIFSQAVMYFIILTTAAVLHAHGRTNIQTANDAAAALTPFLGPFAFAVFAVGLIGTGLLAVPILSASAAYAVKEFFGLRGSLASQPWHRPAFYLIIVAATVVGAAVNFLGIGPVRALVYAAALNGVIAPPLLVLIVLLGGDRQFMGRRVSGRLSLVLGWVAAGAMTAAAVGLLISVLPGR